MTLRRPSPQQDSAPKRRAADVAYDAIETMISTLQLQPGSPVVEAEIAESTGLGRTPVREALLRMVSIGLIVQQPRRGLLVSHIDLADHLDVIQTRRVLERLLASNAARRATAPQRQAIVRCAENMVQAAARGHLDDYMLADHELDLVTHRPARTTRPSNACNRSSCSAAASGTPTSTKARCQKAPARTCNWRRALPVATKPRPWPARSS